MSFRLPLPLPLTLSILIISSLTTATPIPPNSTNDLGKPIYDPSSSSPDPTSTSSPSSSHDGTRLAESIIPIVVILSISILLGGLWYLRRSGRKNRERMEREQGGEMDGGKAWPKPRGRDDGKGIKLSLGLGRGVGKGEEWKKGGKWEELD